MSMLPTTAGSNDFQPKSFWERKEGWAGYAMLGVFALGGLFALQALLPTIISVLTMGTIALGKGITLMALAVVAYGFWKLITWKKGRVIVSYMFKSIARWITARFVEIDPIGIMKNYIDTLIDKKEHLRSRKEQLSGQKNALSTQIEKNKRDRQSALDTAKVARDQKKGNIFQLQARIAGRLEKSNVTLEQLLTKMEMLYRMLVKYHDACDTVIADLKSEVQVRQREREMILAASSAMKAAAAILRGEGDERELFDQATEFVAEDYAKKLGEIEDFMEASKPFMDGIDLQNGVYEEAALRQLEAWESKADSILLGDEKRLMLEDLSTRDLARVQLAGAEVVPAVQNADYDKFFTPARSPARK